jgi:hypothetical protein
VREFLTSALFERDGSTLLEFLPNAFGRTWLEERDGEGSFSFSIPAENALNIQPGRVVKFSWGLGNSAWVFAGVVENLSFSKTGGNTQGEDRVTVVSGRSVRCLLENALVYPSGGKATRKFTGKTPGFIMRTLIDEAQARGTLTQLDYSFSDTLDSSGAAFAKTLTADETAGTTLAEVAIKHQELAIDYNITPDLVLEYYNTRGTDRTVSATPVHLRVGHSIGELSAEHSGPIKNNVLVGYGSDQFTERADNSSVALYGRQETYLNVTSSTNLTHVNLAADQVLNETAAPTDGITVQLDINGPQPYVDFFLCDYVWLVDNEGSRTKYRITSITGTEADDGTVTFVPELGTLRADLTRRLNRALARLESGNANGLSTSGSSVASGGVTSSGTVVLPDGLLIPTAIATTFPIGTDTLLPEPWRVPTNTPFDMFDMRTLGFWLNTLVYVAQDLNNVWFTVFQNYDNLTQFSFNPAGILAQPTNYAQSVDFRLFNGSLYAFTASHLLHWAGGAWEVMFYTSGYEGLAVREGDFWWLVGGIDTDSKKNHLYKFDPLNETLTKIWSPNQSDSLYNTPTHLAVGYGRLWIGYTSTKASGDSYKYVTALTDNPTVVTVAATVSDTPADSFQDSASVLFDGRLMLFYALLESSQIFSTALYCISPNGSVSTQTNILQPLHTLVANGKYVYQIGTQSLSSATTRRGGDTVGSPTGWIIVSSQYGDTVSLNSNTNVCWRVDAVNFYGSTNIAELCNTNGEQNFYAPGPITWSNDKEDIVLDFTSYRTLYRYNIGSYPPLP